MPFYTALFAALGAFLFWYLFLRRPSQGSGDIRQVGSRGQRAGVGQRPVPQQVSSPVTMVNDPVSATTTFLVSLAQAENQLDDEVAGQIKQEVANVMGVTRVDELYNFALAAASSVTDPSNLIIRFARIWVGDLDQSQKQDVYDMAVRVADSHGGPTELQAVCLKQLADKLGVIAA
ncbi:hypothetical protein WJT86_10830 [Microvirga sp. W0021]|uniref:Co-chaperone DjlA N-terminal domain-containing protein n=1 Tax=Hohaiivirga grylli TaxID=3133970 RepID=A0ABV0BMP8_9HYPH